MSLQALHLGQACWALQNTCDLRPRIFVDAKLLQEAEPELVNLFRIVNNEPDLTSGESSATNWALHVIPSLKYQTKLTAMNKFLDQLKDTTPNLDPLSFTDYLCCINSFLSTMNSCDTLRKDKSQFQTQLFEHILKSLVSRLKNHEISIGTVAYIIETIGRSLLWVHGWIKIVLAAGLLTGSCKEYQDINIVADPGWEYKALEGVYVPLEAHDQGSTRMKAEVSGLLQALHNYNIPLLKEHLSILF
ncbi:hypothetical protein C8R44DRAFT_728753 [Mycena epipterygia]|nr:hypothetical protein C8R44DRAFT_728753 [Mycena epipterygia]